MAQLLPTTIALLALLAARTAVGFLPNFGGESVTHCHITKMAALQSVLQVFQEIPSPDGLVLPPDAFHPEDTDLTAEKLFQAYYGTKVSVSRFKHALNLMTYSNTKVDLKYVLDGRRHFDSETFLEAKHILLSLKGRVIRNILQSRYHAALKDMGTMLHTLQDFYSHSNWIELGYKVPNNNLIKPGVPIGTTAGKAENTCTDCSSVRSCKDKILGTITQRKVITTGYFGFNPLSKPKGKCSHGGAADLSSQGSSGINKDSVKSPHAEYHREAARVAIKASLEVFMDIRNTVGDEAFLKFLHVNTPTGLSFVVDTTGSMANDIEAAKQRTINIVTNRRRSNDVPSFYILVPFNDPGYGPLFKTNDPDKFIEQLRGLTAIGGGDIPEMCLSALQLALTNTPPLSYIYVFTDAPAKDFELENTIVALIEQTRSKVSFLLTNALNRRKRNLGDDHGNTLYKQLSQVSGGLAIIIQRQLISQLTAIIADTATSALVVVLQRDNNPVYRDNSFRFFLDSSLHNVTTYISGSPADFIISDPTGVQQSIAVNAGVLGSVEQIGDLFIIRLRASAQTGQWDLTVTSGTPYSVKVTGQSVVDFMYDFVESFSGPHPGLSLLSGRPMAGKPGILAITVTGLPLYPSFRFHEVCLLDRQGEVLQRVAPEPTSSPDTFRAEFPSLPARRFYVSLSGRESGEREIRRQSPTLNSVTHTRVQVDAEPSFRAGTNLSVSFKITNTGKPSTYKIRLTDDQNLTNTRPFSTDISTNETVEGTWVVSALDDTEPGTLITLTVEAQSAFDLGYSVVQLTVTSQVEDVTPPSCVITSLSKACRTHARGACGLQHWWLEAAFTENGGGTGRLSVLARRGNGSLARQEEEKEEEEEEGGRGGRHTGSTRVRYRASCCWPEVELLAVDGAGNVGRCAARSGGRGRSWAQSNAAALLAGCLLPCLTKWLA
uniref:von Willebrand factor A domain-containing protein 7-like n=1 Tax=Pristiophorus japonicus TaxID=55135 RepID=UPI00398F7363